MDQSWPWGSPHGHWNRIHWIWIPMQIQCGLIVCSSIWYADYGIALLDRISCAFPEHCQAAHSADPDRGHVDAKWSLDQDHQSTSDPDPRSCVQSPNQLLNHFPIQLSESHWKKVNLTIIHRAWLCVFVVELLLHFYPDRNQIWTPDMTGGCSMKE